MSEKMTNEELKHFFDDIVVDGYIARYDPKRKAWFYIDIDGNEIEVRK